jgi:hypothetical protein
VFPDQLRAIENEMWTKLDDAVPVETQKEFRDRLNLYTIDVPNDDSGSMGMSGYGGGPGMGMAPGMGSAMGGAGMGMPGGMMGGSPGTGPGLLGWEPEQYPLEISISRSGRWFEWSVVSDKSNADIRAVHELDQGKAPTLPSTLQRFYREPGPWMAVANAQATYAAKDWMKLDNYFTAGAMTREFLDSLVIIDLIRAQLKRGNLESKTIFVDSLVQQLFEEAGESAGLREMIGLHMADQGQGFAGLHSQFEKVVTVLQEVPLTEVDITIQRDSEELKNDRLVDRFVLGLLLKAAMHDPEHAFDLIHGEVSSYSETGDTASATLTIPNKPPVPIRFKRENGQWKIDAIGSNERLLERLKQTKTWKQHAEIEAVLENARTASVLEVLTEEAQSEWLGEMTVAMLKNGGLTNLQSRLPETFFDSEIHAAIQAEYQKNRNLLAPDAQSNGLAGQSVEAMLATTSISAEVRRQAAIDLGKLCGDRDQLLQKLLEFRDKAGIQTKLNGSLSGLREISATSKEGLFTFGWDNPDTRTELPAPVKVVLIQINGLWKLNTIIDPAMKPWPLPAEEPTPPAEATPVDGAK